MEIDSTNTYLKKASCKASEMFCLAEMQTQGRGRFGRSWFSPFGENIYFSARYSWQNSLPLLSGLSLLVSLAVCEVIQAVTGVQPAVKWPNDILWQHKKLAGILIEFNAESHGNAHLIIGIGINVNAPSDIYPNPGKPWCSLFDIAGCAIDRNHVAALLIKHLSHHFYEFNHHGFSPFRERWQKLDYLAGKLITVSQINDNIEGQALGVDDSGFLQVRDQTGKLHSLSCGESSLKTIASG